MWQKIKRGDQDGGEILVEAELFLVSCQQVTRWLRLDRCVYTPSWVKLFLLRLHRFVPLSPWHHVFFQRLGFKRSCIVCCAYSSIILCCFIMCSLVSSSDFLKSSWCLGWICCSSQIAKSERLRKKINCPYFVFCRMKGPSCRTHPPSRATFFPCAV